MSYTEVYPRSLRKRRHLLKHIETRLQYANDDGSKSAGGHLVGDWEGVPSPDLQALGGNEGVLHNWIRAGEDERDFYAGINVEWPQKSAEFLENLKQARSLIGAHLHKVGSGAPRKQPKPKPKPSAEPALTPAEIAAQLAEAQRQNQEWEHTKTHLKQLEMAAAWGAKLDEPGREAPLVHQVMSSRGGLSSLTDDEKRALVIQVRNAAHCAGKQCKHNLPGSVPGFNSKSKGRKGWLRDLLDHPSLGSEKLKQMLGETPELRAANADDLVGKAYAHLANTGNGISGLGSNPPTSEPERTGWVVAKMLAKQTTTSSGMRLFDILGLKDRDIVLKAQLKKALQLSEGHLEIDQKVRKNRDSVKGIKSKDKRVVKLARDAVKHQGYDWDEEKQTISKGGSVVDVDQPWEKVAQAASEAKVGFSQKNMRPQGKAPVSDLGFTKKLGLVCTHGCDPASNFMAREMKASVAHLGKDLVDEECEKGLREADGLLQPEKRKIGGFEVGPGMYERARETYRLTRSQEAADNAIRIRRSLWNSLRSRMATGRPVVDASPTGRRTVLATGRDRLVAVNVEHPSPQGAPPLLSTDGTPGLVALRPGQVMKCPYCNSRKDRKQSGWVWNHEKCGKCDKGNIVATDSSIRDSVAKNRDLIDPMKFLGLVAEDRREGLVDLSGPSRVERSRNLNKQASASRNARANKDL